MKIPSADICLSGKEADGQRHEMGCGDAWLVCPLALAILLVGALLALRWDKR